MELGDRGGSEVVQRFMAGRGGRGGSEEMRDFGLVFGRLLCRFYAFLIKIGPKSGPGGSKIVPGSSKIHPGSSPERKFSEIFRNF